MILFTFELPPWSGDGYAPNISTNISSLLTMLVQKLVDAWHLFRLILINHRQTFICATHHQTLFTARGLKNDVHFNALSGSCDNKDGLSSRLIYHPPFVPPPMILVMVVVVVMVTLLVSASCFLEMPVTL